MAIDADTAAKVAKDHGLTLSDAQALAVLADDEEHAVTLAARFAPDGDAAKLAQDILNPGGSA